MAAPTYQSIASATDLNYVASLTINKPSDTAEGDLLVLFGVGVNEDGDATGLGHGVWSLSGWTSEGQQEHFENSNTVHCTILRRAAGASEPASYTFEITNSPYRAAGFILRISGHDSTTPVAAATWATGGNSYIDFPASGSVTSGDYLALALSGDMGDADHHQAPTNYTERADVIRGAVHTRALTSITSEDPSGDGSTTTLSTWLAATVLVAAGEAVPVYDIAPTDDITTTGWTSTPLWSKIDDDPAAPDATVITATAA